MGRTLTPAAAHLPTYGLTPETILTLADSLEWVAPPRIPPWFNQLPRVQRSVVWLLCYALRPDRLHGLAARAVPGRRDATLYGLDGLGGGFGPARQRLYVVAIGPAIPRLLLIAREPHPAEGAPELADGRRATPREARQQPDRPSDSPPATGQPEGKAPPAGSVP